MKEKNKHINSTQATFHYKNRTKVDLMESVIQWPKRSRITINGVGSK